MTITEKIEYLIQYLKMKVDEKDWHGVSDAANDIRVLEAKLPPSNTTTTFEPPPRNMIQQPGAQINYALSKYAYQQQGFNK